MFRQALKRGQQQVVVFRVLPLPQAPHPLSSCDYCIISLSKGILESLRSISVAVIVIVGAIAWRFDSICNQWKSERTLAHVGNPLELKEGKKGAQRDAFMVEFINQEDSLAK